MVDLLKIESIKNEILERHQQSWANELGILMNVDEAKQIADALEALPKLAEALSIIKDSSDFLQSEELNIIKQALKPFTDKQPEP